MKRIISLILTTMLLIACFSVGSSATVDQVNNNVKIEVNKIERFEEDCGIKIIYPVFSGFNSAKELNAMIQNKNINSIGHIRAALSELRQVKEEQKAAGHEISAIGVSINSTFDYSKNGDILSVILSENSFYGGAHDISYIDSFTVNTKTGEIYTFDSLFNQKSNYKKVVVEKINSMIDKEKDSYFEDAKIILADRDTKDFKFYIDGNSLIIHFSIYDLTSYMAGIPKFKIPVKDLKGLLKDEVYNQTINAKPIENIRFNGTSMKPQFRAYEQPNNDFYLVPLRIIAEKLGYKVTWDSKTGASVAGGYIKNNVNSYYTDKTKQKPIELEAPAKLINNVLYVPIKYFSVVLNEDVSYDGEIVMIYKASKEEGQFAKQIVEEFISPASAEECVKLYVKAVEHRKGALQYALFSEKLRAATKSDFVALNWVTGYSSPWISGYDIKNNGKGNYRIVFHWETSTGPEQDTYTEITVKNIEGKGFWQITNIKQ